MIETATTNIKRKDSGELVFLPIEADLDVRYGSPGGAVCAEFSREWL